MRNRLERKWRKSHLDHDRSAYVGQLNLVNDMIIRAKTDYLRSKIAEANCKDLFGTVNGLLNRSNTSLPVHDCPIDLSMRFATFFKAKIDKISSEFDETASNHDAVFGEDHQTTHMLNCFDPVSVVEVEQVISKLSNKTCMLDPLPTWLLKQNMCVVSSFITKVVNASLQNGIFPDAFKQAIIRPVLKKPSCDANVLKNYRPISNIQFLAKVIECIVAGKLKDHLLEHDLNEQFQSAYQRGHSTETALLKVKSDILREVDQGRVVLLAMLDLTAAFDTINHETLIRRLNITFGVSGSPLDWFKSYIQHRNSRVCIGNALSDEVHLECGTPQGSIMGPLQFTSYIQPIGKIIRKHKLCFHIYADDTQIYSSYNPKKPDDCDSALRRLQMCIQEISDWMKSNKLKLNMDKTEFIIFGSPHNIRNLSTVHLQVGNISIKPTTSVRNLGVHLDSTLSMNNHVSHLCQTLNFQIRNISRIRRYLDNDSCHHIVRSLVLSRLDYGNSLLIGTTDVNFQRLQRIQNRAVRLIFGLKRRDHISPHLAELHWLPVKERVNFKLLTIMFHCFHGCAPSYLQDDIELYSSADTGHYVLRSSQDNTRLLIPRTSRHAGDHSFHVYGPRLWNTLPRDIREAPTLNSFKKLIKSYLFPDV